MSQFDPKIYERDVYQDDIYSAWLKYSNERDVLEDYLRKNFTQWCKKDNLSILEIGCGSGSAARRFLKILDERGISYNYTGIDPYQDQLDRWKDWLPENRNISLRQGTIEGFESNEKFDLVLAIHSLYYVDDLKKTLEKIRSFGSNAFIVHHGERGINEVHQEFRVLVKEGPNIISTYNQVRNTLELAEILFSLDVVLTKVDIRSCHDPKNPDGRMLIKFFLERSELPEDVFENVSKFLKAKGDFMTQDVGYFFL